MSKVTSVKKVGDTYVVEGLVADRKVSVDIHAIHVDGKTRGEADKFFERSLRTVDKAIRPANYRS